MADRQLQSIQDTLRLPIYTENNPYYSDGGSFSDFEQYFRNMVPGFIVDESNMTKEQVIAKRQGIKLVGAGLDFLTGIVNNKVDCTILDVVPITAVYDVFVVSVFDSSNNTIYIIQIRPQAQTAVKIGSFTSTPACTVNDYCFITEITTVSGGNALPAIAINYTNSILTLSKAYYAVTTAGVFTAASLTAITDTSFPSNQTPALITIGRFVFMNATAYIASLDGRITNNYAGQNDITKWTNSTSQLGQIFVGSYPDQCVGIERYKHHIVAFGRNTIEFFSEDGNGSACPISSTTQAFIKFGAKSPRMIRNANDVLYWVSYGDVGSVGLWALEGYTPVKVSTSYIDSLMVTSWNNTWDSPYINLQSALINGKPHIIVSGLLSTSYIDFRTFPTGSSSTPDTSPITSTDLVDAQLACYNVQDKTWWHWANEGAAVTYPLFATEFTGLPSAGNYTQIVLYNDQFFSGTAGNQYVYQLRTDGTYADYNGSTAVNTPIFTIAQMNSQWFGNEKRKRINKVKVIMYAAAPPGTDINSIYLCYLRANEINTGSTNFTIRGFKYPDTSFRYYLSNLGMGRVWSFALVEKSKLNIIYRSLEVDIQQGSH